MMMVFLGIACAYFGWSLAGFTLSAAEYIKVRKEVKVWHRDKAGRR